MMNRFGELVPLLNISKVLVIDDELFINYEERIEPAIQILEQNRSSEEFKKMFVGILDESEFQELLEYGDYGLLYNDEEKRNIILELVTQHSPEMFKGNAYHILDKISSLFKDLEVEGRIDPRASGKHSISEYDLIFMDYEYAHNYTAVKALEELNLNDKKINYVVFVSAKETFDVTNDTSYSVDDVEVRQKLFRKLRSDNSSRFTALLSYINKKNTTEDNKFNQEIYQTLLEFESGKLMLDAINSLTGLLTDGIEEVRKKLLLTNTKTMKALITDKIEIEGVSETSYLVDFSLAMVKNLVNEKIVRLEEIHNNLGRIQGWPCEIWDYETDQHMRDLRKIQLLDQSVNFRYEPIWFGDVFEIYFEGETTKAVLISQICDLVVRMLKKGDELPNRNEIMGTLILQSKLPGNGNTMYRNRIGNDEIYWDVRKKMFFPTELLDLCSTNEDGDATLIFGSNIERKFSWSNHHLTYMKELIKSKEETYSTLNNGEQYVYYNGMSYKMNKDSQKVSFYIKRIGRLDNNVTNHIVNLYVNAQTRVPLPLDPSKDLLDLKEMEVHYNGQKNEDIKIYYYNKNTYVDLLTIESEIAKVNSDIGEQFSNRIQAVRSVVAPEHFLLNDQLEDKRLLAVVPSVNEVLLKQLGLKISTKDMKATINLEKIIEAAATKEE